MIFYMSHELLSFKGLNSSDINVTILGTSTFWCANLTLSDFGFHTDLLLFPINRLTDYQTFTDAYCSHETKSLMYTLGVLYCVMGVIYFIMIVRVEIVVERKEILDWLDWKIFASLIFLIDIFVISCRFGTMCSSQARKGRKSSACPCPCPSSSSPCVCSVLSSCFFIAQVMFEGELSSNFIEFVL